MRLFICSESFQGRQYKKAPTSHFDVITSENVGFFEQHIFPNENTFYVVIIKLSSGHKFVIVPVENKHILSR